MSALEARQRDDTARRIALQAEIARTLDLRLMAVDPGALS